MTEENKIYKPTNCANCPVFRQEKKGVYYCGVGHMPRVRAETRLQLLDMWKNCPIGWDK